MTVPSNINKVSYNGDGATVLFPVPFYFLADVNTGVPELLVTKRNADGSTTALINITDYAVAGTGNPAGGSITTTATLANTEGVTISRNGALTQQLELPETGLLPAKSVEGEFDRVVMLMQQLKESIDRSLKLPITSTASISIDTPVPLALAGWDATGTKLVNYTPASMSLLTAFYQDGSGNVSVGRPGVVYSGKFDINGQLWVQSRASINTGGDVTGTDSVNTYAQYDAYQPNSAMGAVGASSVPGISVSTSRGTGTVPLINNNTDLIGGMTAYAYSGVSPAYNAHAAILARVAGLTAANLGGQLEMYVKADNGSLALGGLMNNSGQMIIGGNLGTNPSLSGKLSVYGTAAEGTTGQTIRIGRSTSVDYSIRRNDSTGTMEIDGSQTGSIGYKLLNGSLAIGPTDAVASALLDMQSTTKGLLPPRMTTTQRNAISSPATGLLVYDATLNQYYYYTGVQWALIGSDAPVATPVALSGTNVVMTVDFTTYCEYELVLYTVACSGNVTLEASSNGGSSYGTTGARANRMDITTAGVVTNLFQPSSPTVNTVARILVNQPSTGAAVFAHAVAMSSNGTDSLTQTSLTVMALTAAANRLRLNVGTSWSGFYTLKPIAKR